MRGVFCEACGPPRKAEYVVSRVNQAGRHDEHVLCESCAVDGERILLGDNGLPLTDLLRVLVTERAVAGYDKNRTKVCPGCGNTVDDVRDAAMVGCGTCYSVFRAEVNEVIGKLHGRPGEPV